MMVTDVLREVVSAGIGREILAVDRFATGGNNQVFRIDCTHGERYLAKVYFGDNGLKRNMRLQREFGALQPDSFDRYACHAQCRSNDARYSDLGRVEICGKCTALVPCSTINPNR